MELRLAEVLTEPSSLSLKQNCVVLEKRKRSSVFGNPSGNVHTSMRQEPVGKKETRARRDVGMPSSDWNNQSVDLKLAALFSTALAERVRAWNSGVWLSRSNAFGECSGDGGPTKHSNQSMAF